MAASIFLRDRIISSVSIIRSISSSLYGYFVEVKAIKTVPENFSLLNHHVPIQAALHDFHHQKPVRPIPHRGNGSSFHFLGTMDNALF